MASEAEGPHGPILTSFDVFWNKSPKHIMVLQFPNRQRLQPYNESTLHKPLELRIKPKCGLVEVDVPINIQENYAQARGLQYGLALKKSKILQQGGAYGMAGGLGIGALPANSARGAGKREAERLDESVLEDFDEANRRGLVMNKITLAGKISRPKDGEPLYAIGVFKERKFLHPPHASLSAFPSPLTPTQTHFQQKSSISPVSRHFVSSNPNTPIKTPSPTTKNSPPAPNANSTTRPQKLSLEM